MKKGKPDDVLAQRHRACLLLCNPDQPEQGLWRRQHVAMGLWWRRQRHRQGVVAGCGSAAADDIDTRLWWWERRHQQGAVAVTTSTRGCGDSVIDTTAVIIL